MRGQFSAYVIPDVGDPIFKPNFRTSVFAESSGMAEARRLIRLKPEINNVEVVTLEGHEHFSTEFVVRQVANG